MAWYGPLATMNVRIIVFELKMSPSLQIADKSGKISLHATVRRNITYDERVNPDIQLHIPL